jgi:CRISPR-associated protein Cas5h
MDKLISIDIKAQFGFLKKPDVNENIYLTYNLLHKPSFLGILGAVIGLNGYNVEGEMNPSEKPEYFEMLKELKIGVCPINSIKGNYIKQVIRYTNTIGYASQETGGVLIVDEQTLIKPSYRTFIMLDLMNDLHKTLLHNLTNQQAEYIPYLGKNDHQLWWEEVQEWKWEIFKPKENFRIDSIFLKPSEKRTEREKRRAILGEINSNSFMYFERLPIGWHNELPHYELREFVYTNFKVSPINQFKNLIKIQNHKGENLVIQIF